MQEHEGLIGIVLITHGNIGQSMLDVASKLVEFERRYVHVVSSCTYSQQQLLAPIEQELQKMSDTKGYLVLTDLFGTTPTNIGQYFMHKYNLLVMSGLNMPMLLKALTYHNVSDDLRTFSQKIYCAAKDCIVLVEGKKND